MSLHRSMSSLILIISMRRYQNRSHHSKRSKRRGNHITHHVSVIVFACPNESAFCFHHTCNCIINQCIEVSNTSLFKFFFEIFVEHFLENIFKSMVILFGNRILCRKPEILFCIQCKIKAASCKTFNRIVKIMHTLRNSCTCKIMYQSSCLRSILRSINKFYLSRSRNHHLCVFVHITICMTCQCNRFFPVLDTWLNSFDNNRCTENRTVQNRTDGSIRAFPHFFEVVLLHTCCIWSNCCTFYCNTIFFGGIGSIYSNLVVCLISFFQTKIIIFCFQINKWQQQFILNHGPENTCHLVSIHFNQRCFHLNFVHNNFLLFVFLQAYRICPFHYRHPYNNY